ncbi:MAG: restriction endonuclease subunit S [Clostridia bacterium]|nr:restriction endonuclease subunit S [Clostridia bacterium]
MSKIEELIEKLCPNGVRFEELKNKKLFKFYYGKGNKIPEDNGGIYNVYGANGVVSHIDEYNCEDISIIGHIGAVGMVNRCKEKCFVTYNGTIAEVVDKSKVNSQYLYYVLTTLDLPSYKKGSQPFLSVSDFDKIRIPVPPLEVQCEIVHILDDFTLLSAELSAELKARQKQYEYYKNKIFNDVVSEKTEFKKLNEITDVRDGTHDSPKPVNVGKYLVTSKNIKNGTVNFDGSYLISEKDYNLINQRSKVDKNDLLFTMIGTIGEVGIVEQEPDYAIKNVGLIKTNNILLSKFLFYYLTSNGVKKYIKNNKSKGSQVFLALGKLRNIPIPVLSDVIVEKIVNILDRFDKLCNDISEGLPAEIEARQKQYEYYRDKLLTFKELKVNE